jgi:hypothetical protein
MSSLLLHELAILLAGLIVFISTLVLLFRKNKQAKSKSTILILIVLSICMLSYPIFKINSIHSDVEKIKLLVRTIEEEPNHDTAKEKLELKVAKLAERSFDNLGELQILAKANFLLGKRKECLLYTEKILQQKPFDEEAQRLNTLSKSIRD